MYACDARRTAAGTVHYPRGVSVAVWWTVLPLQDVLDRNDVFCVYPDYHGVHSRTLHRYLSLIAHPGHLRAVKGSARRRRRVGGRVSHRHSISHTYAHLLLRKTSGDRTPARWLAYLHDTNRMDVKHEIRISGTCIVLPSLYCNTCVWSIPDIIRLSIEAFVSEFRADTRRTDRHDKMRAMRYLIP